MNSQFLRKAIIVGEHIKNRAYSPFTLHSKLDRGQSYSDFFVYGTKFLSNIFIAENIFSMMLDEPLMVNHIFRFYDMKGRQNSQHISATSDQFYRVALPSLACNHNYMSFTHHVELIHQHFSDSQNDLIARVGRSRGLQHRGYLIYKPKTSSIGSIVHGNFGGIMFRKDENICAAAQRKQSYQFTSSYMFSKNDHYHLVFNNPTTQKLHIEVTTHKEGNSKGGGLILSPLGTNFLNLTDYEGTLTFKSAMPLCRPTIFKNPDRTTGFDVFHP